MMFKKTLSEMAQSIMEVIEEKLPENAYLNLERVRDSSGADSIAITLVNNEMQNKEAARLVKLDKFYDFYLDGSLSIEEIAEKVYTLLDFQDDLIILNNIKEQEPLDKVNHNILPSVIRVEGNEELLARVPHRIEADLAVIYKFELFSNATESASVYLDNKVMNALNISIEKLDEMAFDNLEKNYPTQLQDITEILTPEFMPGYEPPKNYLKEEYTGEDTLFFIGNRDYYHGAANIFGPGIRERVAEIIGGDFIIIPSSTHEMLVMPYYKDSSLDLQALKDLVREVNETQLNANERLTDNAYIYDSKLKKIKSIDDIKARTDAEVFRERMSKKEHLTRIK